MEGVGNEVSRKIKAAIKAKLVELGAYVDDELPDYIMIMVANKRSRSQMETDLALFLNKNTKAFTGWLHSVLEKLQQVTVATERRNELRKRSKKRDKSTESNSSKSKKKKRKKDKKQKKKSKKQKTKDESVNEEKIAKKKSKKEKPDIAKEVGRAIIGSLKEKHKEVEPTEPKIEETVVKAPSPVPEIPDKSEIEENSQDLSIIAIKLNKTETAPSMAPTEELMKAHNQLTSTNEETAKKSTPSEDSLENAEELRRQLLLSRTQQKLRERNIASRMRSNSPEVVVVEDVKSDKNQANSDSSKLSIRHSPLSLSSASYQNGSEKEQKKQISSLIVKKAEPDAPEIASFVQVKPREFIPARKQANKNLILKAVAAAERSVAVVSKTKDVKPTREIFTRQLREKRYEKLSVTVDHSSDKYSENDENSVTSKQSEKGKSYIKGWLQDVEDAGREDILMKPDDLEVLPKNGSNEPKIVITIETLSDQEEESTNNDDRKINCISDRFSKINKVTDNYDNKRKYEDFDGDRIKKKKLDGESKNRRLIAELSLKFGKVDRICREDETINRK